MNNPITNESGLKAPHRLHVKRELYLHSILLKSYGMKFLQRTGASISLKSIVSILYVFLKALEFSFVRRSFKRGEFYLLEEHRLGSIQGLIHSAPRKMNNPLESES